MMVVSHNVLSMIMLKNVNLSNGNVRLHLARNMKYPRIIFRLTIIEFIILARRPEIGQGLGRILSCEARNPEQTWMDSEPPPFFMTY